MTQEQRELEALADEACSIVTRIAASYLDLTVHVHALDTIRRLLADKAVSADQEAWKREACRLYADTVERCRESIAVGYGDVHHSVDQIAVRASS